MNKTNPFAASLDQLYKIASNAEEKKVINFI